MSQQKMASLRSWAFEGVQGVSASDREGDWVELKELSVCVILCVGAHAHVCAFGYCNHPVDAGGLVCVSRLMMFPRGAGKLSCSRNRGL